MMTMQFPLNGLINDGKIHEIEPLKLYGRKIGDKIIYILNHRVKDFDPEERTTVDLNSLIIVDEYGNNGCVKQDVDVNYYISHYDFKLISNEPKEIAAKDLNIHLAESIDIDSFIRNNGRIINKKEYIPLLNSNIGESKFIGNAYELTNVFGNIELTKAATYDEKDMLVEEKSKNIAKDNTGVEKSLFSINVEDNTFGHIFAYDSKANMKDIEVLIIPGQHNYEVIYGTFKNPLNYKFARLSNKITFEGSPENHIDADFTNIEKFDKKFYLADNKVYNASKKKKTK